MIVFVRDKHYIRIWLLLSKEKVIQSLHALFVLYQQRAGKLLSKSNMQFDEYSDQTVFITGAASGIGQAQAIAFLQSGANVIGYDIDKDGLNNLLVKYPHHFYYVVGSVSDPKSINK